MRPSVLIIGASPAIRLLWRTVFACRGWDVREADTVAGALASLDPAPDYLILDPHLPDGDGGPILRRVREAGLRTRVAVATTPEEAGYLEESGPIVLLDNPLDVVEVWKGSMLATAG